MSRLCSAPKAARAPGDPVDAVAGGIAKAVASGLDTVIVAQGVYPEAVVLTPGVSLYGGYVVESPVWSRGAIEETPTVIGAGTIALLASGVNVTTEVQRFRIESENATSSGANSEAVRVESSSALVLRDNVIAGDGAAAPTAPMAAAASRACKARTDSRRAGGWRRVWRRARRACTYGGASTGGRARRERRQQRRPRPNGSGAPGSRLGRRRRRLVMRIWVRPRGTGSSGGAERRGTAPSGDNGLGGNGAGSTTSGTWMAARVRPADRRRRFGRRRRRRRRRIRLLGAIEARAAAAAGGCPGQGGFSGTGGGGSFDVFLTDSDVELDGNEITSGTGGAGGRGSDPALAGPAASAARAALRRTAVAAAGTAAVVAAAALAVAAAAAAG